MIAVNFRFARRYLHIIRRARASILTEGVFGFLLRLTARIFGQSASHNYRRWIYLYDTPDDAFRNSIAVAVAKLPLRPVFCLIMPGNQDSARLNATLSSLRTQIYPDWQLYIAACPALSKGLSLNTLLPEGDRRISVVSVDHGADWATKANRLIEFADGDFFALIDAGDTLSEQALCCVAEEINAHPDADLIFSDEDGLRRNGQRVDPWFKPDWNPALMASCNAVGRLGVYRLALVERLGGFRQGFAGAEEYELVLRCSRATQPNLIRHICQVLYHRGLPPRRVTLPDNIDSGLRAVEDHLAGQKLSGNVYRSADGYRVNYRLSQPKPLVSIIVATTARNDILEPCLESLFALTTYDRFELLVVVDDAVLKVPERAALLRRFGKDHRLRIIFYHSCPFNYSWVNNFAAKLAYGDFLAFLNDDTEVISPDWLEQLVARASLPRVAASGPLLLYPDETIQHAGVILGLGGIASHACVHEPWGSSGYFGRATLEQDVSCVTGACMIVRAEAFWAISGFDETMPLAYNDVDLCLRLRASGWRIIFTPTAQLVHHESASLGRHDDKHHSEQYTRDVFLMRQRWGAVLDADPFYNPNLSLGRAYALAFPPRITKL